MYFDPFEELNRMHEEMDRIFGMSYGLPDRRLIGHTDRKDLAVNQSRMPVCHVQETETKILATFELPGVDKKDINLNVEDDRLELRVEAKEEKKHEDKDKGTYSYMSQHRSFYRIVPLPKAVDSTKAEAEYKDGILRVEIPKKETNSKSRRLQIK